MKPASSALFQIPKNIAATAATQGIVACSNLLMVPLFLARWSPVRYGEWLAMSSLAAYVSAADFGMSSAAVNELSGSFARHETKKFVVTLHTALTCYVGLAVLGTAIGFGLSRFLSFGWLGVHDISAPEAALVVWLLTAQIFWSFPLNLILAFYRTIGNYHLSQWLVNLYRIAFAGLTAIALVVGAQPEHVAGLQLGLSLATMLVVVIIVKSRYPELAPGFAGFTLSEAKRILKSGSPFALMTVGNAIAQQGPVLIISSMLGPLFVSVFSTVRTLANVIRQVVGIIGVAAWPELTIMQASGRHAAARTTHRLLVIGSATLSIAAGATLWCMGAAILRSWTHSKLTFDPVLVHCFALQLVLQTPWLASSVVSLSANKNKLLSLAYLGAAVAGCALSAALVKPLGLVAVPISVLISEAFICFHFVIRDSCALVAEDYGAFAGRLWTRVPAIMAIAFISAKVLARLGGRSMIVQAVAIATGTTAVAAAAAWALWLEREERGRIREKLRAILSHFRAYAVHA